MRRLALQFAIASLVPILVLGWLLSSAARSSIEERSTQLYGATTATVVRLGGSVLFTPADFAPGAELTPEHKEQVDRFLVNASVRAESVRVLAVALDGRVIYANYPTQLDRLPVTGRIARAATGRITTTILDGEDSITYPDFDDRVVEATIPLRFEGIDSDPVGIIVADGIDPVFINQVDDDILDQRRLLAGGLAVLWLLLVPILFSVSRRMRRQAQENEHLARHDTLTGLPNRNLLDDRLASSIETARRAGQSVGLLLLDLDRFKEVNDTLGHRAGDELLRHVAERLRDATRAEETVARLGGDEFAVVVSGLEGPEGLLPVLDRIKRALLLPLVIDGIDLAVEASIGVALFPEDAESAESLLQHADIAMYAAKTTGNRHAFYRADDDANTFSRLELGGELRRALSHDRDQLVLHFQPVATPGDGRVVSMEALVRWRHPRRGMLDPEEFLPIAERSGMIHQLTHHVLEQAVAQASAWAAAGMDVSVAANLSARDLRDATIVDEVRTVLQRYGLAPERLEVEVTETAVLSWPESGIVLAAQLRALGVRLALDDFGTGHSSLTNLKRLRPDRLKIDRTFVEAMVHEPTDAAIVRSVIHLAHGLQIGVTAEGVETQAQWDLLEQLGCDLVQGYFLSPPMTADDATSWLRAREVPIPS